MARPIPESVKKVISALEEICEALGNDIRFEYRTLIRVNTSRSYREIRIDSNELFGAYNDNVVAECIGDIIKRRVPGVIGVYPKQFIPDNKVRSANNVCRSGLMIHVKP